MSATSTPASQARARGGRLYPEVVPAPGSDAAYAADCTCPTLDNCRGRLLPIGGWVVSLDCPVHDRADVQWSASHGAQPAPSSTASEIAS